MDSQASQALCLYIDFNHGMVIKYGPKFFAFFAWLRSLVYYYAVCML